jgi:hypothetical protein
MTYPGTGDRAGSPKPGSSRGTQFQSRRYGVRPYWMVNVTESDAVPRAASVTVSRKV